MKIKGAKLRQAFEALHSMAGPAHSLITDYVEGKPVDFNRLENYMGATIDLADALDMRGVLTESLLEDMVEAGGKDK